MIKLSYFLSWHLINSKHISTLSPTPPPMYSTNQSLYQKLHNSITIRPLHLDEERQITRRRPVGQYAQRVMSLIHRGWGEVDHPHGCLVVVLIKLKLKKKFWFWRLESLKKEVWVSQGRWVTWKQISITSPSCVLLTREEAVCLLVSWYLDC